MQMTLFHTSLGPNAEKIKAFLSLGFQRSQKNNYFLIESTNLACRCTFDQTKNPFYFPYNNLKKYETTTTELRERNPKRTEAKNGF